MSDVPITKIEFHEKKSRNLVMPYIETQFHVTDILTFLKWCDDDNKIKQYNYDWIMKEVEKRKSWKRPFPKYETRFKSKTLYIYPKQNIVAVIECGIHYICQHSFDILPRKIRESIYGYSKFDLGTLYPISNNFPSEMLVKNTDILEGFMLHREQVDSYGDSFPMWIYRRRGN